MTTVINLANKPVTTAAFAAPVERIDTGSEHDFGLPAAGIGLCLSGGGYRAMLFHLGALWRLNDLGYLPKLDRVSSVSGGSITAGVLGMQWKHLHFGQDGCAENFEEQVVGPIRAVADRAIDILVVLAGLFTPVWIGKRVAEAYDRYIFHGAKLGDLPVRPFFVINATNIQSGVLWRFTRSYMADYRVGKINNPILPLSVAVAASTAFPPFLSPVKLELDSKDFEPNSGKDLQLPAYTRRVYLTDGGVYDNLGLETVWKNFDTVLISDGGGRMAANPKPKVDWVRHALRVLDMIDNQVRSLRKRQAIASFNLYNQLKGENSQDDLLQVARKGTYWGIWTDITHYELANGLNCPFDQTVKLAQTATRLTRMAALTQERIINWGYAVCDTAMRRHVDMSLPAPRDFPYPSARVG